MRLHFNRRRTLRFLLINALVIALLVVWNRQTHRESVQLAIAKSKQLLDMPGAMAGYPSGYLLDVDRIEQWALEDPALQGALAGKDVQFLAAVPLTAGETRYWQDKGCDQLNCALLTLFDYTNSETVEAVAHLDRREIVAQWSAAEARPGGSSEVLPRAMRIAAADARVRAVLGEDIGLMDPAMIPMSGWLVDNACREEWCVDLTFHDPAGTGRVFHVFVNLEAERVARTFFTRARPDRSLGKPLAQRNAFSDGCHEQDGWSVCWEMTANDGINFRDATYLNQTIFSSAKIGQIEAWYPSWPGGYRDEIGFAATVPPFGGTEIVELEDAFEIRQMFTEFTRWPNCICCYRYEQIVRFFADGRFELRFISHGPGCDDLSIYRPFWRVDVDLNGGASDSVWLFDETQWVEQPVEFETYPVVEGLSPEGHKLATFDGDLHYRWAMERTDPLGLDEAYLFLLQKNPLEGEEPIATGPGDTFIPPRQWIDDDPLSGQDIVLWYVPLLNTKRGGPWWCLPDPEPEFNPCEAILRADPAGELTQPTAEELAALQLQALPTPTRDAAAPTAAPTATPRPIEGVDAESIIMNAGCGSCHKIGAIGEAHKVGPDLSYIGLDAAGRVPDLSAEQYIHQSIVQPNAYLAPACPNGPCLPGIMPQNYEMRLSNSQVDTVVAYLLAQQGPEPTPPAVGGSVGVTPAPKPAAAAKVIPPSSRFTSLTAVQIGMALIVLIVTGFLIFRDRPVGRDKSQPDSEQQE